MDKKLKPISLTSSESRALESIALEAGIITDRGSSVGRGSITGLIRTLAKAAMRSPSHKAMLILIAKEFTETVDN